MMKHIFIYSFFWILSMNSSYSQNSKLKQKLPSLIETVKWLNNKMLEKPSEPINEDGTVNKITEWISNDGKTFNQDFITYKTFSDVFSNKPKLDNRNITTAFFRDLNPNSIKTRYYQNNFFLSVSTTNSVRRIKVKLPTSDPNEPIYYYDTRYTSTLDFGPFDSNKESNLELRISKALKHLIILNGGKSEAF